MIWVLLTKRLSLGLGLKQCPGCSIEQPKYHQMIRQHPFQVWGWPVISLFHFFEENRPTCLASLVLPMLSLNCASYKKPHFSHSWATSSYEFVLSLWSMAFIIIASASRMPLTQMYRVCVCMCLCGCAEYVY